MWHQHEIHLQEVPRGFHLITDDIIQALPGLAECSQGLFISSMSIATTAAHDACWLR